MVVDLIIRGKMPTKDKCDMCEESKPTVVMFDPNMFPDNGDNDTWDVCESCRKFINWGMENSYKLRASVELKRRGINVPDELLPDPGFV